MRHAIDAMPRILLRNILSRITPRHVFTCTVSPGRSPHVSYTHRLRNDAVTVITAHCVHPTRKRLSNTNILASEGDSPLSTTAFELFLPYDQLRDDRTPLYTLHITHTCQAPIQQMDHLHRIRHTTKLPGFLQHHAFHMARMFQDLHKGRKRLHKLPRAPPRVLLIADIPTFEAFRRRQADRGYTQRGEKIANGGVCCVYDEFARYFKCV